MVILIMRFCLFLYFTGVCVILARKASKATGDLKGALAVILFPLMLLTKKGRKQLRKE